MAYLVSRCERASVPQMIPAKPLFGAVLLSVASCLPPIVLGESVDSKIADNARHHVQAILDLACETPMLSASDYRETLDVEVSTLEPPPMRGSTDITRWLISFDDKAIVRADFIAVDNVRRQVILRYSHPIETDAEPVPVLEVMTDQNCDISRAREITYSEELDPVELIGLDANLARTAFRDPVDPPLPALAQVESASRVAVAVVDSGIDYRSDKLLQKVLMDEKGSLVGYDYWDDDALPFDSNPSRSPFYPTRHGTRIANIVVDESEVALIAPYRYPRFNPERFEGLIRDVADNDISIVNLSMGSRRIDDWPAFREAVKAHPEVLFVVSAGNDAVDVDVTPIYPAAFDDDNILTVTSSKKDGTLAQGSNWGAKSIDLMVPAEGMLTTGFADRLRQVSGSSYAAARVSALAACLLKENPEQTGRALKARIVALAGDGEFNARKFTRFGFASLALDKKRGVCRAHASEVEITSRVKLPTPPRDSSEDLVLLDIDAVITANSGWDSALAESTIKEALHLLAACRVTPGVIEVFHVNTPREIRLLSDVSMHELVAALNEARSTGKLRVFFLEDTLQPEGFGAEAIGRANARRRKALEDTVWLTRWVPEPGQSLAHEVFHVLADSGLHSSDATNLMSINTNVDGVPTGTELTESQCGQLRNIGKGNALLYSR